MKIFGLQKLSLLDYPSKLCATVFTSGCNMCCPYCHNGDLVLGLCPEIPQESLLPFLKSRRGKLEAICISGGEPLLHPQLESFVDSLKDMGYLVKLDTNGSYPERLEKLLPKLDYVAMDVKNSLERYAQTVGLDAFDSSCIPASIMLIQSQAKDYAFRTTLMKPLHSDADIHAIGRLIRGAKRYDLQNYAVGGKQLRDMHFEPFRPEELQHFQAIARQYVDECIIKNE